MSRRASVVFQLLAVFSSLPVPVLAAPVADLRVSAAEVHFEALVEHAGAVLAVETPTGDVVRLESASGIPSFGLFDPQGQPRPDGLYRWELRLSPRPGGEPRMAVPSSSTDGAAAEQARIELGHELVQTGSFTVEGAAFVVAEERAQPDPLAGGDAKRRVTAATQVINDDLQVNGWMLLRDYDLRIRFDDTGPSGFPANDWQLTANEFSGLNKFSIEDVTGAAVPFTILAGAPSHSFFVNRLGHIGLGTSLPERRLHIKGVRTSDLQGSYAPAIRLENVGEFPPQTWEIVGYPSYFGVLDVTSLRLPFRIRAGAAANSLVIDANGYLGIGTSDPASRVHVWGVGPGATDSKVLIENANATMPGARELLELQNDSGQAVMIFKDSSQVERWAIGTLATSWVVDNQDSPATIDFTFANSGDFTAAGTITPGSSRTIKQAFAAVEPRDILARVAALPITSWSYKADPTVRHIGPMAEDFFTAFAVGADAKGISVTDSAGVALAAIQALHAQLGEALAVKETQIEELQRRLAALEAIRTSGN